MKTFGLSVTLLSAILVHPIITTNIQAAYQQEASTYPSITAEELLAKMNKNEKLVIIDVRSIGPYKSSTKRIKGDIRVEEPTELDDKLKTISKDQIIVTYCACPDEATSNYYVGILKEKGFKNAFALKGGYYAWLRVDGPMDGK